MTARVALALALLALTGCAASRSGGGGLVPSAEMPSAAGVRASLAAPADSTTLRRRPLMLAFEMDDVVRQQRKPTFGDSMMVLLARLYEAMGVPLASDSMTLRFTAPSFGSLDCVPDSGLPLRAPRWCAVLRLNETTPPNYRRGCEANVACWDSVRAWNEPDTVWATWAVPGQRCSVRVAPGLYAAMVRGQRCPTWRVVRVP